MEIKNIQIATIKLAKYNPRRDLQPGDPDYEKLKKSMREFDLVEPLVWNKRSGNLIGGHQRLKILIEQGAEMVDVSVVDLPDRKEKALNLALNKIRGDWDMSRLRDILGELDVGDFDIEITGFDDKEIETLMTQFNIPGEGLTPDDEIPEKVETICKTGDLWQLGSHRLLCGDSTIKENIDRLMDGERADMVFTDPPYGIDLDTDYSKIKGSKKLRREHPLLPIKIGRKWESVIGDDQPFNAGIFIDYAKEIFLWGADYYIETLPNYGKAGSWFVWDKRDEETDNIIGNTFELCWSKQKHKRQIIRKRWIGILGLSTQDVKQRLSPTMKPVEVCDFFIRRYSRLHDLVLDPFGGSGSTMIAAEKLGRRCFMMEISPEYTSVILKRWANFTGKEPVKLN